MVSFVEIRRFLRDVALAVSIVSMIVFCLAVVSIASDVHSMRTNTITSETELRVGLLSRVDSLLWKLDSLAAIASTFNKSLASQLTQVRVQVKQSSDATTDQTKQITKATTNAVKESLATAQQAIAAVADKSPPIVHVTPVPQPVIPPLAPVIVSPITPPPLAPPPMTPKKKSTDKGGFWHWIKQPFSHDDNAR